jgi:hypothetical protein
LREEELKWYKCSKAQFIFILSRIEDTGINLFIP